MRLIKFINIIELTFPDLVCQLIDNNTAVNVRKPSPTKKTQWQAVGYISTWDIPNRCRKETKYGTPQVTYIRNCSHKGLRALATLHGIQLIDSYNGKLEIQNHD